MIVESEFNIGDTVYIIEGYKYILDLILNNYNKIYESHN